MLKQLPQMLGLTGPKHRIEKFTFDGMPEEEVFRLFYSDAKHLRRNDKASLSWSVQSEQGTVKLTLSARCE